MVDTKVLKYSEELKKLGIRHEILEHPPLVKVEEVQKYLRSTIREAGATILMNADGQYIAIVRRGDCKLNFNKIKKILKISNLRVATDDEFKNITKVPIGAAQLYYSQIPTLIDSKIFELEYVNAGSGSLSYTFRYKTSDLKKLPHIQIADISEKVPSEVTKTEYLGIKRVLSGIRATGRLHLGNYLGAVKGMLELQNNQNYETFFMVADLHTITTPFNIEELRINRREVIIDYLAAGLDPKKSIIFQQAEVKEHAELAFYFGSVMSIARMQHLPTYKEKVKQYPQNNNMALLNYPLLMASDILLYKASMVPVGVDQEPHLEVAREVARKINQLYSTYFPEPVRFATKGEYIPSLTGEGKMSKTVEGSYINLTDSLDEIKKKIRSVPTATTYGGEMTPGVKTLFTFANLFIPKDVERFKKEFDSGKLQFVQLKDTLAEAIYHELKPFQNKRKEIEANQQFVDKVIKEGAAKARAIASKTVKEVKEKMGLL